MSEAALITTTEYDRNNKVTRAWIANVESKVDTLRAEFDQFKIDIRSELATAVAGLNQQILGNRLFSYPHTMPFISPSQEIGSTLWNKWIPVDLSSFWASTNITIAPAKAIVLQVYARIWWTGPLQQGDGLRYLDVDFSGTATSTNVVQDNYAVPAPSRRVRVSGAKDDSTYADSVSQELTVPVYYQDNKPWIRMWYGSNGGEVSRQASIAISGWKY